MQFVTNNVSSNHWITTGIKIVVSPIQ